MPELVYYTDISVFIEKQKEIVSNKSAAPPYTQSIR